MGILTPFSAHKANKVILLTALLNFRSILSVMTDINNYDFSDLSALYINCTLTKSPAKSHTQLLIDVSKSIMEKHGVQTESIRAIDHDIASGVYPDMTEHGWASDEWPSIYKKVQKADILIIAGPIWLGDNSSETKKVIERLYGNSSDLNSEGQYAFYGKAGGCLITGNEDGIKHCAMNILYSLQHLGYTIPPQADAGWIGEAGPGPSYGDVKEDGTLVGVENDFTNRNTTFMTWNLMHCAKMLKDAGGIPAYGNQRSKWDAGARFDFENPEYR
jgi:multimeric flavodoxin WrbA